MLGQFDTLEIELDNAQKPDEAYNAPRARVVLRASFDEQLGYPKRFQRRVLGTHHAIEWQVTRFDVVEGSAAAADDGNAKSLTEP